MKIKRAAATAALLSCLSGTVAQNLARGGCAVSCSETGPSSSRWTKVHRLGALDRCNKTQLLDSNIRFPIEDEDGTADLRACTADEDDEQEYGPPCGTGAQVRPAKADVQLLQGDSEEKPDSSTADVAEAAKQLARNLKVDPTCGEITKAAKKGSAVVGVFVGSEIRKSSIAPLVEKYVEYIETSGDSLPPVSAAQICGPKGKRSSRHSFGIIADRSGDLQAVNDALSKWHDAECLEGLEAGDVWVDQEFSIIPATAITMGARGYAASSVTNSTFSGNSTAPSTVAARSASYSAWNPSSGAHSPWNSRSLLVPRAECKTYEVKSGDDCWTIATDKCGLKNLAALYNLNKNGKKMCEKDGIMPGDHFCCTKGTMPDFSPKPNPDGTCKHVLAAKGDGCDTLAKESCDITTKQFYEYNGNGKDDFCDNIKPRQVYCCSPGKKPDLRPKKNKDGTCRSYTIKDKLCGEIQDEFFLKDGDFDKFNKGKTWGWAGCKRLMQNQKICLSDGEPPMPAQDADAMCGPTVVGTKRPGGDKKFASLNQCPLNACCNTWGQCGVTKEVRISPAC